MWKSTFAPILPEIGAPTSISGNRDGKGGGNGEYQKTSEKLNDEERKGAWVLGGVVGLGLLIGGPGREKKGKKGGKGVLEKGKEMVGAGGGGVQGDQEWEKASGAGVVGHGARKE